MSTDRELVALQLQIQTVDADMRKAEGRKNSGAAALLVAILGTLFVFPLLPLWLLIGIAGLLAYATNRGKANNLQDEKAFLMARVTGK